MTRTTLKLVLGMITRVAYCCYADIIVDHVALLSEYCFVCTEAKKAIIQRWGFDLT